MRTSLATLRAEHVALQRVLRGATALVADARARRREPDFALLRAMLFYLAEFPERHHHRKESALLFPRLRARTPLARHVLDHLDEDHLRGEARIRELAHALAAFEVLGESRRDAFEAALAQYVAFYRAHVALEEDEIFPLAERVLLAADWDELDAEFQVDRDPLTGADAQAPYARLAARLRAHLDGLFPVA